MKPENLRHRGSDFWTAFFRTTSRIREGELSRTPGGDPEYEIVRTIRNPEDERLRMVMYQYHWDRIRSVEGELWGPGDKD